MRDQLSKTMVTPGLPWELESEILSRVPPTSVKQLRLTCKRWYALFKDPIFINNHLGKAATQMILKNDNSVYSFSFSFHRIHNGYDHVIELTDKLRSLKNSEDVKISTISHCKGLLLCTTEDNRLMVWNPCTGQTRWIQSKPSSISYAEPFRYYLGYGKNNKSLDRYKILSCSHYYCKFPREIIRFRQGAFEIYEFNSDSWRVTDAISGGSYLWDGTISLKGDTYWLDTVYDGDHMNDAILRFDFTAEKFERLSLPCQGDEPYEDVVLSSVREEKLALLCQYYSLNMKIWVTNTTTDEAKDLSWSEFLVVDFGKLMVDVMPEVISFLVDEENKKVMCCDTDHLNHDEPRTRIYIVGEDIHKNVFREALNVSRSRSLSPLLVSYVPSLVQIPTRQSDGLVAKEKKSDQLI